MHLINCWQIQQPNSHDMLTPTISKTIIDAVLTEWIQFISKQMDHVNSDMLYICGDNQEEKQLI